MAYTAKKKSLRALAAHDFQVIISTIDGIGASESDALIMRG
jgi:hypothetical protein